MNQNEQLVERFYKAFQKRDYNTMQDCYSANPVFSDPVFGVLEGGRVKKMWEMLCKRAVDFSLDFEKPIADGEYVTCKWTASYTFTKTGRKIVNHCKGYLRIENERITEHTDYFDLYKWIRQAFGLPGILFGWSGYLKTKVRTAAKKQLDQFVAKGIGD